jgi:hypothetical protein
LKLVSANPATAAPTVHLRLLEVGQRQPCNGSANDGRSSAPARHPAHRPSGAAADSPPDMPTMLKR